MLNINTVTILGANGTMGRNIAAIFAAFGKCKVYLVCRSREKAQKAVQEAYMSVRCESIKKNLIPSTYDDIKNIIPESDLILESLAEDYLIKSEIYNNIKPYIKENVIIATGTSGLSIKKLSQEFGKNAKNFFGIHMFNPPYNLPLCELILHSEEQYEMAFEIEKYLTNILNRTVVKVKDAPAFLGNRVGFFFINEALKLAIENKDEGGIDYIDSILGCFSGRNMPPLATAEFVGLDITKAIIDYVYLNVDDKYKLSFKMPEYVNQLIQKGFVGNKSKKGLFYKDIDTNKVYVYDILNDDYREKNNYQFYFSNEMIELIKNGRYKEAINVLLLDNSREALILKRMILKYIIYSLYVVKEVGYDIKACDDAMARGFSWLPPLAWIDLLGGIENIIELTREYLDVFWIKECEELLNIKLPITSKYDYRSYLKARY